MPIKINFKDPAELELYNSTVIELTDIGSDKSYVITKVPGGWIYRMYSANELTYVPDRLSSKTENFLSKVGLKRKEE